MRLTLKEQNGQWVVMEDQDVAYVGTEIGAYGYLLAQRAKELAALANEVQQLAATIARLRGRP